MKYPRNGCTQDYFATYNLFPFALIDVYGLDKVTLRDILKHKLIILYKDDAGSTIQTTSNEYLNIIQGLQSGMSIWTIARSPFNPYAKNVGVARRSSQPVPVLYQAIFGIDSIVTAGWQTLIMAKYNPEYSSLYRRAETFIGAVPYDRADIPEELADLPILDVDPLLIQERYLFDSTLGFSYPYYDSLPALPEVGYIQRMIYGAVPLYQYRSMYRDEDFGYTDALPTWLNYETDFHGTTVATAMDAGLYKAAHFNFSLMAFDDITAQQVYDKMMTWLMDQAFIKSQKAGLDTRSLNSAQRLRAAEEELLEMRKQGLLKSIDGSESNIY
jgi:hypothetical protein